jgi:hypothetical protein
MTHRFNSKQGQMLHPFKHGNKNFGSLKEGVFIEFGVLKMQFYLEGISRMTCCNIFITSTLRF